MLPHKPCLRPLDFQPVSYQGQPMWLLQDPLRLSSEQLIMPQLWGLLLMLLDGTRTIPEIHQEYQEQMGDVIDLETITHTIETLDQNYLLWNVRFEQAKAKKLAQYRAQPHRLSALAGHAYPEQPTDLTNYLHTFASHDRTPLTNWQGRGIISPHIDYQRGGDVYAQVWQRAAPHLQNADLILIFGTDHQDGEIFTLTEQPYATPYGILPTDSQFIHALAQAIGHEIAFATELHHIEEHSIELSAVWLHHVLNEHPTPPVIPILCGSFYPFLRNNTHPNQNEIIDRFSEVLHHETAGKKVVAIASVDFAHVGPAFGDDYTMTAERREQLTKSDKSLIEAIRQGNVGRFYDEIATIQDQNRICGFSPIYHLMRYLGDTKGLEIAYQHCEADNENNSLVSIAGILLD